MLDEALSEIVFDIALEGENGCSFDQFFKHLQKAIEESLTDTKLLKPLQFDEAYKSFLWTRVRTKHQLVFTKNDTPMDAAKLSYEQVISDSGSIIVKAAEKIQDDILYGHFKSEKKSLSEQYRNVLSVIAKGKEKGITQFELAELLEASHKSIYIYVRKLSQLGLIRKEKVYEEKRATNILQHWRFACSSTETTSIETEKGSLYRIEKLKDDIIEKLQKADNNMMSLLDLVRSLGIVGKQPGKWVRSKIAIMHDEGQLEKFIAYDGTHRVPSVRLLKGPQNSVAKKSDTVLEDDGASPIPCHSTYAILRDMPFEYQVYQDIVRFKGKGFSKVDFMDTYPYIDSALFKFLCDTVYDVSSDAAQQKYPLYCTEEIGGKVKQYRYYSTDGWKESASYDKTITNEGQTDEHSINLSSNHSPNKDEYSANRGPSHMKRPSSTEANDRTDSPRKKVKTSGSRAGDKEIDKINSRDTSVSPCESVTTSAAREELDSIPMDMEDRKPDDTGEPLQRISKRTSRRSKATIQNNTKARRRTIILDMLERQPILELNHELYIKFVELEAAAANGQGIARKTFYSLTKQLHEENKLKYYVTAIETFFGIIEKKTFLLHPSLTENDEQVQQFIDNLKKMTIDAPKRRELKTVSVDEVPTRGDGDISSANVNGTQSDHGASGTTPTVSESEFTAMNATVRDRTWSMRAMEYGYSPSRWQRARILHETMFDHCLFQQSAENVIVMNDVLKQMPLRILMSLYGVLPYENQTLVTFLKTKANHEITLYQLPRNIKVILTEAVKKFRYSVIRLLRILKALDLIETVHDDNLQGTNIPLRIALRRTGTIRDYTKKEGPLVAEMPLQEMDDVHSYWTRLQMQCTDYLDEVESLCERDDTLAGITNRKSWSSNTILTDEQKAILNSFVDFEAKTVPDDDNGILRSHIMKLTKLPWRRVKKYYAAMLVSFEKFERKKVRTEKLKKTPRASSSSIVDDLMRASIEKRKVALPNLEPDDKNIFQEPTFIGSRKFKNLRLIVEPHPPLYLENRRKNNRSVDKFTSIEKDILIHAYCIMKTRAEMSVFYWSPISQVIPNHNPERCRRKLNTLLNRRPLLPTIIEELKAKWKTFYQEGIGRQEIKDESPWDTINYDLSSYLEYFLRRLQEDEMKKGTILLPQDITKLKEQYHIKQQTETRYKQSKSSLSSPSVNRFDVQSYDTQTTPPTYNEAEVHKQLIKTLIKMNFMTPDEHYSREDAYRLLSVFSEDIIQETLHELRSKDLIVNDKSRYGRIPGRRINVSERFMNLATSLFPVKMLEKAQLFHQEFTSKRTYHLGSKTLDGSSMATLLDLLSQGKLNIDLLGRNQFLHSKKVLYYPKLTATDIRTAFISRDFDLQVHCKQDKTDGTAQNCILEPPVLKTALAIADLNKCDITSLAGKNHYARVLYEVVHSFRERGASWFEIESQMNMDSETTREALRLLLESEPRAVQIVGFDCLRYVAMPFAANWFINDTANTRWIYPVMWCDANGRLISSALNGTAEVVLSHIMAKPGITFANLRAKLRDLLSDYELYRMLVHLENGRRIVSKKVRCASKPHNASLFTKRRITAVTSGKGLNNDEITHYWLLPDYYLTKT